MKFDTFQSSSFYRQDDQPGLQREAKVEKVITANHQSPSSSPSIKNHLQRQSPNESPSPDYCQNTITKHESPSGITITITKPITITKTPSTSSPLVQVEQMKDYIHQSLAYIAYTTTVATQKVGLLSSSFHDLIIMEWC